MGPSDRALAEQASFQAFLHGYLQEVDPGHWQKAGERHEDPQANLKGPWLCELTLTSQRVRLVIDVGYRSAVGQHRYGKIRQWLSSHQCWSDAEPFQVLCLLVRELYTLSGAMVPELRKLRELELLHRITDSYRSMIRYLERRRQDARLRENSFIESEQSLLFGHASHPTPKSRQGLTDWQQDAHAPELAGRFQLHYFLVHRDCIYECSDTRVAATRMVETLLRQETCLPALPDDYAPVPAHPVQAQWLQSRPGVRAAIAKGLIRPLGALGPEFTATSSVRTLYCDRAAWMLKCSIPVQVTNSLRVNKAHELRAGVLMSQLIRKTGFATPDSRFHILQDPAFLTVRLPGQRESGFEVIFRDNPFTLGRDRGIVSVAALTQDPLPGRPSRLYTLIEGLALNENRTLASVSRDWFRQYLACAIAPALTLYDEYGIALEAHQQNSLLDISGGYPGHYYYRDNQGYYLSESMKEQLVGLCPELSEAPELFYRDAMIRDRFCYYLVVNQLFSVIARFGRDNLQSENALLRQLRHFLGSARKRLQGPSLGLVNMLLDDSRLPYKGNLLTRVHDIDELNAELEMAVYTSVANPLRHLTLTEMKPGDATPAPQMNLPAVNHGVA